MFLIIYECGRKHIFFRWNGNLRAFSLYISPWSDASAISYSSARFRSLSLYSHSFLTFLSHLIYINCFLFCVYSIWAAIWSCNLKLREMKMNSRKVKRVKERVRISELMLHTIRLAKGVCMNENKWKWKKKEEKRRTEMKKLLSWYSKAEHRN